MIYVKLTNGFGNNLFQYTAAKVLAEFHNTGVVAIPVVDNYYAINDLKMIGVNFATKQKPKDLLEANDKNYISFFDKKFNDCNILLSGYFEDYRYYYKMRNKIKSWFPPLNKENNNDLVVHMRTGDRLFMKNEFYMKPTAKDYLSAVEKFDFNKMHIVTDMPKWDYITKEELKNMNFHVNIPSDQSVPIEESVEYFNSFVEGFSKYNPIIKKRTIYEDFSFIRNSDNILFEHGTLSWWAAFLSEAKKVGVYGPWRPWKGQSNKNLSNIPLKEWFKWE